MGSFELVFDHALAATASLRAAGQAELAEIGIEASRYRGQPRAIEANRCPLPAVADALSNEPADSAELVGLVNAIKAGFNDLTWFRNAAVPASFVARSAAAELIGPDGGIASDSLRLGLFFIIANTNYQRHWHDAREHYLVLSGGAEWDLDKGWEPYRPGDVITVPSGQPHAIRTTTQPVVCLYSWTGDITFDTYRY